MKRTAYWLPIFAIVLAGCSDDTDPADAPDGDGDKANTEVDVDALYACDESDFTVTVPFTGPNVDPNDGSFVELTADRYVIHTTHLIYKPESLDEVLELSFDIFADIALRPGFLGMSTAGSERCTNVRTVGVWASEEAMYGFVAGEAHMVAMSRTTAISRTGKVTHFEATPEEVSALDWDVARAKIAGVEPSPLYD